MAGCRVPCDDVECREPVSARMLHVTSVRRERPPMGIRLASLNLHCGLDHRGAPFSVKQAVAVLDTDVIVIQENWRTHGEESLAASAAADCGYSSLTELDLVPDTPLADLDIVDGTAPDLSGAWG